MEYLLLALDIIILAIAAAILLRKPKAPDTRPFEDAARKVMSEMIAQAAQDNRALREELDQKLDRLRDSLTTMLGEMRDAQQKSLGDMSVVMTDSFEKLRLGTTESFDKLRVGSNESTDKLRASMDERLVQASESQNRRLAELVTSNTGGMDSIRNKVDERLDKIQSELEKALSALLVSNEKKLEEMRQTVNEKLEKTLETRLQKSFETVSTQLESVNRGLGEMKSVAESVGSLNKVLSGAKTRGILGELQLGQIIEDMLPPQLYDVEVPTVSGSRERVEYAIKLPGAEEGKHVYLPIDSKFPLEDYYRLLEGYETGDAAQVEASRKALLNRVKGFAKDVKEKYVSPPDTTAFAVIFLPAEGLYSEIVRDPAFLDNLRHDGIIVTGPSTLSAMLNSLQIGFKTLQIQKGAAQIEIMLGVVKKEFESFEGVLSKARDKVRQAGNELDQLAGTRTRAINRSLREVQTYTGEDSQSLLGIDSEQ